MKTQTINIKFCRECPYLDYSHISRAYCLVNGDPSIKNAVVPSHCPRRGYQIKWPKILKKTTEEKKL